MQRSRYSVVASAATIDITGTRLRNQRLSGVPFTKPEDVVSWMGAVQAQEYADAKWGLALRTRNTSDAAIERALAEGTILRTHVMRPTWHFVAAADIRWMLALTAARVGDRMAPYNRRLDLDAAVFRRSRRAIVRALSGGAQLTRQELKAALNRAGVRADNGQRLAHIVMQAELEGAICSGAHRGRQCTYALLDERVPASRAISRDEARGELARRYFTSHGPAQLQDFVWWSGQTVADARAGLEMAERDLSRDTVDGRTYWFSSAVRALARPRRAYLLPIYDEYLIAYKDRSAALDASRWSRAAPRDAFTAPVVVDGRVAGAWRKAADGDTVVVTVTPLAPLSKRDARAIVDAARDYARFVGLELELSWR